MELNIDSFSFLDNKKTRSINHEIEAIIYTIDENYYEVMKEKYIPHEIYRSDWEPTFSDEIDIYNLLDYDFEIDKCYKINVCFDILYYSSWTDCGYEYDSEIKINNFKIIEEKCVF